MKYQDTICLGTGNDSLATGIMGRVIKEALTCIKKKTHSSILNPVLAGTAILSCPLYQSKFANKQGTWNGGYAWHM